MMSSKELVLRLTFFPGSCTLQNKGGRPGRTESLGEGGLSPAPVVADPTLYLSLSLRVGELEQRLQPYEQELAILKTHIKEKLWDSKHMNLYFEEHVT